MRLTPPELNIAPDEGFTSAKDIFERKDFGERLTRIVQRLEGESVILLDAPWGMGKTTFVKMWRGDLLKAGIRSVYFDAFANDYHDDAFLALAGEVVAKVGEEAPTRTKALKSFKKSAIGVAKVLGRTALSVGINVGTAGLVDAGAIAAGIHASAAEIASELGKGTAKALDEIIRERLESHHADRKAFEEFRSALSELVGTFSTPGEKGADASTKKSAPLVFIIDELDRCRPTFAITLLEKIKHFFSVPGLTFLLVTNLTQLEASVRFAYGDIEAKTYLEKFYHLRLTLPPLDKPTPDSDLVGVYLKHLFSNMMPKADDPQAANSIREMLTESARIHSLSLRTLERVCAHTGIFLISIKKNYLNPAPIVAGLSLMKTTSPELYQKARTRQIDFQDVQRFFQFDRWLDWHDRTKRSRGGQFFENWWRYILNAADPETKRGFDSRLGQYNFRDRADILGWCCDFIDGVNVP